MNRPSAPHPNTQVLPALLCGLLSFLVDFCLVPHLVRGTPDWLWMALLVLLPVLPAVALRPRRPRHVFLGLLVQWVLLLLLARPVGAGFGFHLESLAWDLFDWIAYAIFALGWSLAATLVQFAVLAGLNGRK